MSWIKTYSSGWINEAHVTRLFVTNDVLLGWQVKASMPGPQQPIVVRAHFEEAESAEIYLVNVIRTLTNNPQEPK
jgi:hypothetical protein